MYSIQFPKMVSNTNVNLVVDHEATASNLKLMLLSTKNSLLGDPYFGTNLRKFVFDQNNQILRDLVVDDIYTAILTFMPQIRLERKDITVVSDRAAVYAKIKGINLIDFKTDLYDINLTNSEEK